MAAEVAKAKLTSPSRASLPLVGSEGCPRCFLIVYNVSKKNNVFLLTKSAIAFGAEPLIVGMPQLDVERCLPPELRGCGLLRRFACLADCLGYVRAAGAVVVGVEIDAAARNVETEPFVGITAFMVGNEGTGMNARQRDACDAFVIISQYGVGTASLNVAVAGSIVLQRFRQWAQGHRQPPRRFDGAADDWDAFDASAAAGAENASIDGRLATFTGSATGGDGGFSDGADANGRTSDGSADAADAAADIDAADPAALTAPVALAAAWRRRDRRRQSARKTADGTC
ncbi:unnamed protein product [Phaeothamnion confervicola]